MKKMINIGKRSKAMNKVKPVKITNKYPQKIPKISAVQKEVPP